MHPRNVLLALGVLPVLILAAAAAPPEPDWKALHQLVRPQKGESKWTGLKFEIDLYEARKRAVKEDKPIFFYRAGGGEALGRA